LARERRARILGDAAIDDRKLYLPHWLHAFTGD